MSVKATVWAWQQEVGGNTLLVLLRLADHANDRGEAWPSKGTIAKKCKISESTVKTCIKELLSVGCISKIEDTNFFNGRSTVRYKLNIELSIEQAKPSQNQTPSEVNPVENEPRQSSTPLESDPVRIKPRQNSPLTPSESDPEPNKEPINTPLSKKTIKKTNSSRRTKPPETFEITDKLRDWFVDQGFTTDIEATTQKWLIAMKAKGSKYVDWNSAWQNGMLIAQDWQDEKFQRMGMTKTLLPEDWAPHNDLLAEACNLVTVEGSDVDISLETDCFALHHVSQGSMSADWDRAFLLWVTRSIDMRRRKAA